MMDAETEELSALLAAELADNDLEREDVEAEQAAPRLVDTRQYPARFHNLFAMGRSPAHGRASFVGADRELDTLAIRLGAGTHAMLFGKPWIIYPGRRVKGKKKPSAWDMFREQHADKVILSPKEHARAKAIGDAIRNHPIANRLLFSPGVIHEETILFEQDGRARRSTPDARGAYHLVELKTARNVEKRAFCRDAGYRAYHAQLADQCAAIEAVTGTKPREVYIVAVESSFPYVVQVFQAVSRTLELGAKLAREWLDRLTSCELTGVWPGYSMEVEPLEVWEDVDHDAEDDDPWKEAG